MIARGQDLIIENVRLYRDVRAAPEEGAEIVLRDGVVAAPGEAPSPGATRFDARGLVALPGLGDAHCHLPHTEPGSVLAGYPRDGVTWVRSMGNSFDELQIARQTPRRARLLASGPGLTAPGGHPAGTVYKGRADYAATVLEVASASELRDAVARLAGADVSIVKVFLDDGRLLGTPAPKLSYDLLRAAVVEAHQRELPVAVHCSTVGDYEAAMEAGVDEVTHVSAEFAKPWVPRDLGRRLAQTGALWVPTLYVTEVVTRATVKFGFRAVWRYLSVGFARYLNAFRHAGGLLVAGSDAADTWELPHKTAPRRRHRRHRGTTPAAGVGPRGQYQRVRELAPHLGSGAPRRVGSVRDLRGSSSALDASFLYRGALPRELRAMAEMLGLSASEALETATTAAARAARRDDLGHLRAGAVGDIALYRADPVRDLDNLDTLAATVLAGELIAW